MTMDDGKNDWKALDEAGFIPGATESEAEFRQRVRMLQEWSAGLERQDLQLPETDQHIPLVKKIARADLHKQGDLVWRLYGARPDWVPAYYEDRGLPLLTGGMAVTFKENETSPWKTFFQLKSVFQKKDRWLIYGSGELINHEMCHVARAALRSVRYEEYFAYQTSASRFRRWIGGALLTPGDNKILLLAIGWLLAVDVLALLTRADYLSHTWLAVGPLLVVTVLGLWRNGNIHGEIRRARALLLAFFGQRTNALLFRLTDEDIRYLSTMKPHEFGSFWTSIGGFRGHILRVLYMPDQDATKSGAVQ